MFSQLYYSVRAGIVKMETYPWDRGLKIKHNIILFIIMNKNDKVNIKVPKVLRPGFIKNNEVFYYKWA